MNNNYLGVIVAMIYRKKKKKKLARKSAQIIKTISLSFDFDGRKRRRCNGWSVRDSVCARRRDYRFSGPIPSSSRCCRRNANVRVGRFVSPARFSFRRRLVRGTEEGKKHEHNDDDDLPRVCTTRHADSPRDRFGNFCVLFTPPSDIDV